MDNKEIVVTGERFIPEVRDEELEIEHLERYLCIRELVKNKVVLDAACGEGYGSHILSQTAKSVLGIDIDEETIQRARTKYGENEKLNYKQASVADLSIVPANSIDVVVSYETIEHIDEESQLKFLEEISRVLKTDGILVMSTPNKEEYTDKYQVKNKFHVKEFYVPEFIDFLSKKFQNIKIYNQYLEVASFIDCPNEEVKKIQYCINREIYETVAKYVIAIASNACLPEESIAIAFTHLRREYMPMMEELNYCRHEAIVCRKKAEKLDECLNENKLQREELDRRAIELEERMSLINELREKNICIEQVAKAQEVELERRAQELEHRMDEINRRDSELDEKKNEIKLLNEELERRAVELLNRMDKINEQGTTLEEMCNKNQKLEEKLESYKEIINKIKHRGLWERILNRFD